MSNIEIREAKEDDFEFIATLMDDALKPYYDGDHRAHAERIFKTHIGGGADLVGHFSAEQRMFILVDKEVRLGMINIVGKRQGTWKIEQVDISCWSNAIFSCQPSRYLKTLGNMIPNHSKKTLSDLLFGHAKIRSDENRIATMVLR